MSSTTSGGNKHDWTKPAAMAIPKGGFVKDKVEQGRLVRSSQRLQRAMASRFSRKSSLDERSASTSS